MTKQQQHYQYLAWGGTMTLEEWEQDGRFDPGATSQAKKEFNPEPIVKMFDTEAGPEEVASVLDDATHRLAGHFISESMNGDYFVNMLWYMRQLRNAILKGADIIDFDKH